MVEFDNGVLNITRGDSGIVRLELAKSDDTEITDYTATMSIKKNIRDDEYALQVACDNGMFQLEHADTENLEPGNYVCDVQIIYDGSYYTMGPYKTVVLPDVTRGD